jgi:hypothetical protein
MAGLCPTCADLFGRVALFMLLHVVERQREGDARRFVISSGLNRALRQLRGSSVLVYATSFILFCEDFHQALMQLLMKEITGEFRRPECVTVGHSSPCIW